MDYRHLKSMTDEMDSFKLLREAANPAFGQADPGAVRALFEAQRETSTISRIMEEQKLVGRALSSDIFRDSGLTGSLFGDSAVARAARGEVESPTIKAFMAAFDSPSMRFARGEFDSPTTRMLKGEFDSPTMKALRGGFDGALATTVFGALDRSMIKSVFAELGSNALHSFQSDFAGGAHGALFTAAETARKMGLPDALAEFGASTPSLAMRLSLLQSDRIFGDRGALGVFAQSAAFSNALSEASFVDRELMAAAQGFSALTLPDLGSLGATRAFLDASGLFLRRWPPVRLLSVAEKRRRMRIRLARYSQPPHVKKAKSIVYRYELVLREIIDAAMAGVYGEDWQAERLPACGCKTLLGRAQSKGGAPLDHADYAHYRDIMIDPEHFEAIFSDAFDTPDIVATLINDAGRLRARSHHPHPESFTPDDLRDLRVVWRTIEAGLLALMADYDFDHDDY